MNWCVTSHKPHAIFFSPIFFSILNAFLPSIEEPVSFVMSCRPSGYPYVRMYRSADKFLARSGRKQANVSVRMKWISFGALPCREERNLMTARVSMLLKSRASLTCFRACLLPGRAKDLSASRYQCPSHQKSVREIWYRGFSWKPAKEIQVWFRSNEIIANFAWWHKIYFIVAGEIKSP